MGVWCSIAEQVGGGYCNRLKSRHESELTPRVIKQTVVRVPEVDRVFWQVVDDITGGATMTRYVDSTVSSYIARTVLWAL